jgi:SAM-dependent methyltransferase
MSDEVRSRSVPTPVHPGELVAGSVDGAQVPAAAAPSEPPPSRPTDSERPTNPLPREPVELMPRRTPTPVPEVALPRSERPPPPSQRAAARLAAAASTPPGAARTSRSITPLPISVTTSLPPPARPSEPVPLVHRTASSMAPQPPPHLRSSSPPRSSLPPGLVEPKRIIEVLGSNVPVLDNQLEEEIEDLDDSEAHELADSGPDADVIRPTADLDLDVDFDNSLDGPGSSDADLGSALAAEQIVDVTSQPPARADGDPSRPKTPPKRRRRPPPPSTRHGSGEHRAAEKSAADKSAADPGAADAGAADPPAADQPAADKAAVDKAAVDKAAVDKAALDKLKSETASGARKWWEEMFSEEFLRAIPILSPRQLEREVNFIEEGLGVAPSGQILDLACGAGQHAVELAARGYDVVGFDLSQSQLDWASGLALERNQRLQFTNGDMRELSYQESFDAIYSWNTSFGFFEEEKNLDVALRVFKALRPGGRFLLDVINRDFVVEQQPGQTWFEGDGCVCIDDVTIDFITSRMKVKRTLMLTNGKNRECTYSVRIYGLHELGKILHDVGFKILKVSGRPEMPGVFFGSTSPRVIILAGKPPC